MISTQKSYKIYFGEEPQTIGSNQSEQIKNEIPMNNVLIKEEFPFYDYNSSSTIDYLKEYFLTTFGQKYKICKCVISVYYKKSKSYVLLSIDDKKKLSEFKPDKLYVIKTNTLCECEYKMLSKYMNMEKFDVIAELKATKERIEELEDSQQKLKKLENENYILKKTEEIEENIDSKMEKFYDIVICINSVKSINKEGWEVKFDEKGRKKYESHKNKDSIIIGVLGNNNKGKSFLLTRLSKIKLLSGTSINTEGLSVKYPDLKGYKGRKIILLDSAGLETPVLKKTDMENKKIGINKVDENEKEKEKNKEFKENTRDKIMTELFLQNFIIDVSDVLLVVVGKLTYSEQLLINKIKEQSKKIKRIIFIIHNLQEFWARNQVENYIKNTLLNCSTFKLKKRTWISTQEDEDNNEIKIKDNSEDKEENLVDDEIADEESKLYDIHFTEIIKFEDKKLEVYHLILANENSEAGKIYNPYAYKFIEHVYNFVSEPKKFDIFDQVKINFKKLSGDILRDDIKNVPFTENKIILEEKKIRLEYEKDLSLKKCYTDELGFSFFKTGDFEPKYNYFKPDEHTLEVRVEVPGNIKCSVTHKITENKTIIIVKGVKQIDKSPSKPEDMIFNMREFSEFELNIPLKVEEFEISQTTPKKGYPKFVNGVFCVQYELAKEAEPVEKEQSGL